jgi:hypothetical protein
MRSRPADDPIFAKVLAAIEEAHQRRMRNIEAVRRDALGSSVHRISDPEFGASRATANAAYAAAQHSSLLQRRNEVNLAKETRRQRVASSPSR